MSDPTISVIDNSDLDLTGVPMSEPVINNQPVRSVINNLYWEELTDKPKGADGKYPRQLAIFLTTLEPALSTDGRDVPAGHKTPKLTIYATPTGGLTQDMINKKVGRFQVAALGLSVPEKFGSSERYIGREVRAYFEAEAGKKTNPVTGQREPDPTQLFQRVNKWEKV